MPGMRPAADGSILVGTASWTDKTLIACGRFYPKEARTAEARLRHYASRFPIVEVDSSYYALPVAATARLWVERTPPGFVMNVKAFRLFTGHQTAPAVQPRDLQPAGGGRTGNVFYKDTPGDVRDELWRRFHAALAPLRDAGRLGLVHFQFPPWVVHGREGRAHVRHCVERMAAFDVSVEFRHRSWFDDAHRDDTLAFERELGVVHTVVDGPQGFSNSVPAVWATTQARVALLRLHGRNTATWNLRGAAASSDRFNYDYPDAELAALAGPIRTLARTTMQTHVIFNNNMEDQGQRNAATMQRLLSAGV